MKNEKPAKTITLTPEEWGEYNKFKPLAHYDPDTQRSTFNLYNSALKEWTDKLRKKHKLDDKEAFVFL